MQFLANNKNNLAPYPSEGSVVARGTARASERRGEKGLTVGANPGHKQALVEDDEKRPGFGSRSSHAPGG